ncbi:putative small G-protein Ras2 [Xylaria palmicola]|nr:putative small G-protein Ras2 [Xylaria palmicola]
MRSLFCSLYSIGRGSGSILAYTAYYSLLLVHHLSHPYMDCGPIDYRIVVLGAEGIGKTSLTMRFLGHGFSPNYDPTIEDSFRTDHTINDLRYSLKLLDTSSREQYVKQCDDWIRQSDGVVLVYNVTSRDSFGSLQHLIDRVIQVKKWGPKDPAASCPSRLPIMIVGNKIDLQEKQVVEAKEGHKLAGDNNCMFTETSAMYGKNVNKAFSDVVKVLISLSSQSSDAPSPEILLWGALFPWMKSTDGGCCNIM